ncbi:biopolymer transporter ExbD [Citromicrobium bathyomarinum]|uniref:ExbD/TolR family protein n=1 Tax=Citromicrobium bathyomarinum TaxID=72174 RepID=UPI00315A9291
MAFAASQDSPRSAPMAQMNMTPLIDVLLVLLIMFVITIPIAVHATDVDLPNGAVAEPSEISNKIVVTEGGAVLWNGEEVDEKQLVLLLKVSSELDPEPELQFEPEANASYDLAARTLNIIRASPVTKFGFVGNEKYREFETE